MDLTIAIITKKNPVILKKCLSQIARQTQPDFAVLIVDNDSEKTAEPVFDEFKSQSTIPVEYVCEPVPGYSRARNCAIMNCKSRYLGFIDDDCVLAENWVEQGLAAIQKYQSAYVVGCSKNAPSTNIFARVERFITSSWWVNIYDPDSYEMNSANLDTKNVILDKTIMEQNRIKFDERFNRHGGEDTDLGFQMKDQKLIGYYVPGMELVHEEASSFKRFKRKAFSYGYNCYNLYQKWSPKNECQYWDRYRGYRLIDCWLVFFRVKQGNILKDIRFFFFIKLFNFIWLRGFFRSRSEFK